MYRTPLLIEALGYRRTEIPSGDTRRRQRQREFDKRPNDVESRAKRVSQLVRGGDRDEGHRTHMEPHVSEFNSATREILNLDQTPREQRDIKHFERDAQARKRVANASRNIRNAAKEIGREAHEFLRPGEGEAKQDHVYRLSHLQTTRPKVSIQRSSDGGNRYTYHFDMRQERDGAMKAAHHHHKPGPDSDDRYESNASARRHGHSFSFAR